MAATTAETLASRIKSGLKAVEDYLRGFVLDDNPYGPMFPVNDIAAIPTTSIDEANDIIRISPKMPAGTYCHDFRGTPTDMDTNVSPAHVYDVVYVNEASVTQVTLVSGSTKSQAASGSDRITDAAAHKYCGEGYVALKTTTASATPAAGTYKWAAVFSIGTLKPGKTPTGPYLLEAEV